MRLVVFSTDIARRILIEVYVSLYVCVVANHVCSVYIYIALLKGRWGARSCRLRGPESSPFLGTPLVINSYFFSSYIRFFFLALYR